MGSWCQAVLGVTVRHIHNVYQGIHFRAVPQPCLVRVSGG